MDNSYSIVLVAPKESIKLVNQLKENRVNADEVDSIARGLAMYHKDLEIVRNAFDINGFQKEFGEIKRCSQFIRELMNVSYNGLISESIETSNKFLNSLRLIIQERTITGKMRDGHGNLSASWIFLNDKIYIKEYKDHDERKSQIDVLNDLARLGLDLDFYGLSDYSIRLFESYSDSFGDENNSDTRHLYNYYKSLHVNRIIINLVDKTTIFHFTDNRRSLLRRYLDLYQHYHDDTEAYLDNH
jgi:aminoglycoside phosphotransferase family enzyme